MHPIVVNIMYLKTSSPSIDAIQAEAIWIVSIGYHDLMSIHHQLVDPLDFKSNRLQTINRRTEQKQIYRGQLTAHHSTIYIL